jgi:hypothetical protein
MCQSGGTRRRSASPQSCTPAWASVRECHLARRRICLWVELLLRLFPWHSSSRFSWAVTRAQIMSICPPITATAALSVTSKAMRTSAARRRYTTQPEFSARHGGKPKETGKDSDPT